jgi:hypothetical protein
MKQTSTGARMKAVFDLEPKATIELALLSTGLKS